MLTQQKPQAADDQVALWAEAQTTALAEHFRGEWTVPAYGSPEWLAMRADDPRRAAAIIEAAELWRRHTAREAWLDSLDAHDWYAEVFKDTSKLTVRQHEALQRLQEMRRYDAARGHQDARPVQAAPGWPPVAIPGRPGWRRQFIHGRQVDVNERQEQAA